MTDVDRDRARLGEIDLGSLGLLPANAGVETKTRDEELLDEIDLGSMGIKADPRQTQLNVNMSEAVKVNPAQHAKVVKLSQESGVPVFAVKSNPEQVEQKLKLDQIDLAGMTRRSPKTSKFLTDDPNNAVIAQEDVMSGLLEGIEQAFSGITILARGAGRALEGVGGSIGLDFEQQGKGLELAGIGVIPSHVKDLIPRTLEPLGMLLGIPFDSQRLSGTLASSFGIETDEQLAAAKVAASDRLIGEIQELQKKQQTLTPEDLNIVQEGIRSGVESMALMAPGVALTILSGGGTAPLLTTMGVQSFASSFAQARAKGLTPSKSAGFATINAAIDVGTELLPLGTLERIVTGSNTGLKKEALKFAVQEMGTEQLATALQSATSYLFGLDSELENATSASDVINIQLRRQAVTAIATAVAGSGQISAATAANKVIGKLGGGEGPTDADIVNEQLSRQAAEASVQISKLGLEEQAQAAKSTAEQASLDKLSADALKSELRKHDVESFKKFVQEADSENDTHVFIDGAQTALYLQGKTPDEIANDPALKILNDAVQESRVTGADVSVPIEDFMGDVVGTEAYTALRDSMTMSADAVSPFRQGEHQKETAAYVETLMAAEQDNASEYVEAQEIYTKVRDQLVDTGVVSAANASIMAQVVPAWATAKAKSSGQSVQQVYADAGLTVEGPQTGELARLEGEKALKQESLPDVEAGAADLAPGKPMFQKTPDANDARGYYDPVNSVIRLNESADLSTFLHEFAHFMYGMEASGNTELNQSINNWYKRNAVDVAEEASGYLNGHFDPLKQGPRVNSGTQTVTEEDVASYLDTGSTGSRDKDMAVHRSVHEQFARGFETYLMEGKAPSIELRNAFRTFARWLSQIYKALRGDLKVKLDEGSRQFFDRLLATENQIAAAESRARIEPMFTDAAMAGMTDEEFSNYQQRQGKVKDVQSETLRDKMIGALTRQTRKWWKEEKADLVVEERARLEGEKVYATAARLRDGDLKLDLATVKEMVGEERTNTLGRTSTHVPGRLRGMTAPGQKGVHPDDAAAFLGYNSGAEMLDDLVTAPPIGEAAETAAEAKMIARHGDVFTDGTIEQQADEAVQSEERGKLILRELKILSRGTNQRTIDRQTMKAVAADKIGELSFRENHPGKYRKAEIQAAQESARMLAEGNKEGAAQAKARQAINYYLGMASVEAKTGTVKIIDGMGRYNKKKVREGIQKAGGGYWDQIVRILNRFEFRKSATLKSVNEVNQNINTWSNDRMNTHGDGLVLGNVVLDESYTTHWKNVPYNDLQSINDSVRNIEHVARYSDKLTRMGEEITFDKLVGKLVTAAAETGTGKFKKTVSTADQVSWAQQKGRWAMAQMTKIPFMMSWMDGLDRVGLWHNTFSQVFTDAYDEEMQLIAEVGEPIVKMIRDRSKETLKRHNTTFFIPEIKGTAGGTHTGNLKGHEILAVALNTGNKGNLRKLLLGEGWATDDAGDVNIQNARLQAVLKHLTKSDWDMVQEIWDQLDKLYPKLAEVHRRTTGEVPPKVEAVPVVTEHGTFRGGYYPVKYDPTRSRRAAEFEARKDAEVGSMFASNASIQSSVNAGATNTRTGFYDPIHLTLNVVPNHIQETIHYITHHDAVREVNKLLRDPRIADAVSSKLGPDEFAQLKPWLNDIAKDGRNAPNKSYIDAIYNQLRMGTTLGVMGYKATTSLLQLSGWSNTVAEVGLGPAYQAARTVLGSFDTMQSAMEFAFKNSKVLNHRVQTMDREVASAMKDLTEGVWDFARGPDDHTVVPRGVREALPSLVNTKRMYKGFQEASMKPIAYIQTYLVDLPSWHAAYIKELGESGDEQKAFQYADWVVENIQGSGLTKDLPSIMRNQSKMHKTATMFMTFYSAMGNAQRDLIRGAKSGKYSTSTLAGKAAFMYAIPVLLGMLIAGEFGGDDDDADALLQKSLLNVALYPMQTMPWVRDVANGVFSGYRYQDSPIMSVMANGLQAVKGVVKAVFSDGELTTSQVKSISKLAGAAIGFPGVNQLWGTGEHLFDVLKDGEELTLGQLVRGPDHKKR